MKRVIVLAVVLMLVGAIAMSEGIDLAGMSYDELVALREQINLAIWKSEEWEEVTVPQGTWSVGEDIPSGHWTVEAYPGSTTLIKIGDTLQDNGKDVMSYTQRFFDAYIVSPTYKNYKNGEDKTTIDFEFLDGDYVQIKSGSAVFKLFSGKPDLGFKKGAANSDINEPTAIQNDDMPPSSQDQQGDEETATAEAMNNSHVSETETIEQVPDILDGTKYELINYNGIARNPSLYKEKLIYFFGKVIQVSESSSGTNTAYRIQLDDSSDIVLVHKYTSTEPRILKDDHVLVYGTCNGVETYQSVLGGQITIPSCTAKEIRDASRLPKRKQDPVYITGVDIGNEAAIHAKNNTGESIKEIGFRARYYDADGNLIFLDSEEFSEDGYYLNAASLNVEYPIEAGQTMNLICADVEQFAKASRVEIAFKYYVTDGGNYYLVPERYLNWYSSETRRFIDNSMLEYLYSVPDQKMLDDSKTFMLGIFDATIYPEFKEHYSFDYIGSYIFSVDDGSVFAQLGIEPGDIILKCDGVSYLDDDYTLERAKAKLANGKSVEIELARGSEKFTVSITPEMIETDKAEDAA